MKKNMVLAALIGVTGLLSAGSLAGYLAWRNPAFAEVVSVEPVKQYVAAPDRSCGDAQVSRHETTGNEPPVLAVVIDGMAGGMITRQPARLEKIATLGTVAAGDPAGRMVQENKVRAKNIRPAKAANKSRPKQAVAPTGTHCRRADRVSEKIVAYDVHYRLHGKTTKVRMDHDPGARLPVRNGRAVIVRDSGPRQPKA